MKKLIPSLFLLILISILTSFSVFAYGWEQDSTGWRYQREYGGYIMNQWFQDPSTGYKYHFNTFGYMDTGVTQIGLHLYYLGDDGAARANACLPSSQIAITDEGYIYSSTEPGLLIGQITQYNNEMNAIEVKICNMRNVPILLQGKAELSGSGIYENWYLVNNSATGTVGMPVTIPPLTTLSFYFSALDQHAVNFVDFPCTLKCHYTCDGDDSYWVYTNVIEPTDSWFVIHLY